MWLAAVKLEPQAVSYGGPYSRRRSIRPIFSGKDARKRLTEANEEVLGDKRRIRLVRAV